MAHIILPVEHTVPPMVQMVPPRTHIGAPEAIAWHCGAMLRSTFAQGYEPCSGGSAGRGGSSDSSSPSSSSSIWVCNGGCGSGGRLPIISDGGGCGGGTSNSQGIWYSPSQGPGPLPPPPQVPIMHGVPSDGGVSHHGSMVLLTGGAARCPVHR